MVATGLLKGGLVFLQSWLCGLVVFGCSEPAGTWDRLPAWPAAWPGGMHLLWSRWWVGQPLGISRLEGGFQNNTYQHPCHQGGLSSSKWLPPVNPSPGGVLVASCLSMRLSKVSKWASPTLLSNYYLYPGSRNVWHPLRVESLSYNPPALLNVSLTGFQRWKFWGLIFPTQDPQAGEPNVGLRTLFSWGGLLQL